MRSRLGRSRRGVGRKVILPFVVLSMVSGVASTALVGMQVASAIRADIDAQAIREQDSVASSFGGFEQRQLTDLRTMASTQGVAAAMAAGDAPTLKKILLPVATVQLPDPLRATAISPAGKEILSIQAVPGQIGQCVCRGGRDLSAWPHVGDVLAGRSDSYGSKYIGVVSDTDGQQLMYTIGPVTRNGQIVAAMLVGEPLTPLLADVRARSGFAFGLFSRSGDALSTNTDIPTSLALSAPERNTILGGPEFIHKPLPGGSGAEVFFVPWKLRHETAGYAAVVVPANALAASAFNLPALLLGVFAVVFALTLGAGLYVARKLTQPLKTLVRATREVAAGHLDYQAPVTTDDEIGDLTGSFNTMTNRLRQQVSLLEESAEATVQTLASAIDARDAYTHGHSLRVTAYSLEMGKESGLERAEMDFLRRGGLVHDIGKIGVSDAILQKPAPLTAEERAAIEAHPALGEQMLRHLDWDPNILQIVRHHHERYDGNGYPDRLAGDDIPMLARLVAVADSLDAMTSDRPYRDGFSFKRAANEVHRESGKQFDPGFVEVFARCRDRLEAMAAAFRAEPGLATSGEAGESPGALLDEVVPVDTETVAPRELEGVAR